MSWIMNWIMTSGKKQLQKQATGWICAGIIAIAAVVVKQYPDAKPVVYQGMSATTNYVWMHQTQITNAIGEFEIK